MARIQAGAESRCQRAEFLLEVGRGGVASRVAHAGMMMGINVWRYDSVGLSARGLGSMEGLRRSVIGQKGFINA